MYIIIYSLNKSILDRAQLDFFVKISFSIAHIYFTFFLQITNCKSTTFSRVSSTAFSLVAGIYFYIHKMLVILITVLDSLASIVFHFVDFPLEE